MPHTIISEVGRLSRAMISAAEFISNLQTEMSVSPEMKKLVADSVITVETNNQGVLTVVIDFAPGTLREGSGNDVLHALLAKNSYEKKEHRAGGKYHSVWECRVRRNKATIPNECFMVRVTHAGGNVSVKDKIEDSHPGVDGNE